MHDNNNFCELEWIILFLCTQEPVQMVVTFVGNGTETFSIKWSVPTQNSSSIPKGVTLNCTNTSYNVILNTSITHADTTVRLDLNKTVMCCVSAPSTKTKCVTYTPDVNGPGKFKAMQNYVKAVA